jgi:putative CocE/NonD family hydrolase
MESPTGAERERPASLPVHGVAALFDVRIAVSDGLELSANLWLPEPSPDGTGPVTFPALLEMLPYRKDDWHAASDQSRGEWLAARGFAYCRIDIRGTGSSPGIALDEYTARETQDGYDAVEWLAAQAWSNGRVGCGASRMAGSRRSRSPCSIRRTSPRSSR